MEDNLVIVGESRGGRATQLTGVQDDVKEAYNKAKLMIKSIAQDIGEELESISNRARPKQVEMEFNIGISAQVGPVWILSGKGEYGLKVKMIWELTSNERDN